MTPAGGGVKLRERVNCCGACFCFCFRAVMLLDGICWQLGFSVRRVWVDFDFEGCGFGIIEV